MKKMVLTIALLVSCSMTSILYSQSFEARNKIRAELKPYMDTLNFEYEGSLQIHEKIIVRVISHIQKKIEGYYKVSYNSYALVKSYNTRISSLAENYVRKNSKVRLAKSIFNKEYEEYDLDNGFNAINNRYSKVGKLVADNYMLVVFSHCNIPEYYYRIRKYILDNVDNNDFATLLSEAEKNGIKKAATENGFYNKKLAKQLAEVILINRIEELYKSNRELSYRIVYIADAIIALFNLTNNAMGYLEEEKRTETLKMMLNKY